MGARASPKRERGNQSPILIAVLDLPVIGTSAVLVHSVFTLRSV